MMIRNLLLAILLVATPAYAHPGRTNSEGCHNNRKTGDYHCHNGGSRSSPRASFGGLNRSGATSSPQTIQPLVSPSSSSKAACGSKTRCGEMTSCAEARMYLTQCGLTRLDGDRDGVPCESLCR